MPLNAKYKKAFDVIDAICEQYKNGTLRQEAALGAIIANCAATNDGYYHDEDDEPWRQVPQINGKIFLVGRVASFGPANTPVFTTLVAPSYSGPITFYDGLRIPKRVSKCLIINDGKELSYGPPVLRNLDNPWVIGLSDPNDINTLTLELIADLIQNYID